jgi:hypothetical protein
MIATRTKAALAAAKARGVKLGGPKLAEARELAAASIKTLADRHAANVLPIVLPIIVRYSERAFGPFTRLPMPSTRAASPLRAGGSGTPSQSATCSLVRLD